MKKLILLAVIGVSLHCNAQISKESAYQFLTTTILKNLKIILTFQLKKNQIFTNPIF